MSDQRLNAAFLVDLGVSTRERLLAAPETRDHSLRGRTRPNGSLNSPSEQPNGSGDAITSGWQAFASHNKDNVDDDLHGGQLHRLNREAMGYGSSHPMPAALQRQQLPHFDQPQKHHRSSFCDPPRNRIQYQARAEPPIKESVGGGNDALDMARSMKFTGSYSGKGRGGRFRGNPSTRGPDFCSGRGGYESRSDSAGYSLQDARSSGFHGGRSGYATGRGVPGPSPLGRGRVFPTRRGSVGGRVPRDRGELAIRGAASRRPQSSSTTQCNDPWASNGHMSCEEDDTFPVQTKSKKLPSQKPQLVSAKEFMSTIMDSKWAPEKS